MFFENENVESFISSLIKADKENPLNPEELESITLTKRSEEILSLFISTPGGFNPQPSDPKSDALSS